MWIWSVFEIAAQRHYRYGRRVKLISSIGTFTDYPQRDFGHSLLHPPQPNTQNWLAKSRTAACKIVLALILWAHLCRYLIYIIPLVNGALKQQRRCLQTSGTMNSLLKYGGIIYRWSICVAQFCALLSSLSCPGQISAVSLLWGRRKGVTFSKSVTTVFTSLHDSFDISGAMNY